MQISGLSEVSFERPTLYLKGTRILPQGIKNRFLSIFSYFFKAFEDHPEHPPTPHRPHPRIGIQIPGLSARLIRVKIYLRLFSEAVVNLKYKGIYNEETPYYRDISTYSSRYQKNKITTL